MTIETSNSTAMLQDLYCGETFCYKYRYFIKTDHFVKETNTLCVELATGKTFALVNETTVERVDIVTKLGK